MLQVAESLKKLRKKNHYTQEQLASLCMVSRQSVTKWESGVNVPDVEKLLQLAELFHTTVDELLRGTGPAAPDAADSQPDGALQNEKIVNQALQEAIACNGMKAAINKFLASIGKKLGCDRLYIFEAGPGGSYSNTYEWCAPGVASQLEFLQNVPAADMSGWLDAFARQENIVIEDIEALAESDPSAYRWLKPQGIHSLLASALFDGRCFLGIDNPAPAFIPQLLALLAAMSRTMERMLQHRDTLQEVKAGQTGPDAAGSKSVFYQINITTGQLKYDTEQAQALGYPGRLGSLQQLEGVLAFHPECREHIMNDGIRQTVRSRQNVSIEFLSLKENQAARWNRLTVSPYIGSNGAVLQLYGVLRDISDRHPIIRQYNGYLAHLAAGLHICYLSNPIHLSYASDALCRFTGYTRDEFEQLAGYKYSNIIVEEDRPAFSAYAKSLGAAPGIASCEYRIRRKDGRVVPVIDTMESIRDGNGIMYGYAYVLDKTELQVMLARAESKEKKHLAVIGGQSELLAALGRDYTDVFHVWLDEDRLQLIKQCGTIVWKKDRDKVTYLPYYASCRQLIEGFVAPEDRTKMLHALHPDTVRQALARDEEYQVMYRVLTGDATHFFQLKYVRLPDTAPGAGLSFIGGCKNIDLIIAAEQQHKEQLGKRRDIITTMLQAFSCGYYLDYASGTFWELANTLGSNAGIFKLLGRSGRLAVARRCWQIAFPDKAAARQVCGLLDAATLGQQLQGRKSLTVQLAVREREWYEMYFLVVDYDSEGKVAHSLITVRDITQEKKQEQAYLHSLQLANRKMAQALQYAFTDSLTGVKNRNAFEKDIQALDSYTQIGLIFCDLNNLKLVNDNDGHEQGDRLLQDFVRLLKKYFPAENIYRIGGDEFVCIIGNIDRTAFLELVTAFTKTVKSSGNTASLGASYGRPSQRDLLLREAELEMYNMKDRDHQRRARMLSRFEPGH